MIGTSDGEVFQNEFDFVSSQFAVQSEPQKEPLVPDTKSIGEDFFERYQKMKRDFQNQVPTHEVDPPAPGNEIGGRPITMAQATTNIWGDPPQAFSKGFTWGPKPDPRKDLYIDPQSGRQRSRENDSILDRFYKQTEEHAKGLKPEDFDLLQKWDEDSKGLSKQQRERAMELYNKFGETVKELPTSRESPGVIDMYNWKGLYFDKVLEKYKELNPVPTSNLAGKQFAQAGNIASDASPATPLATPSEKRTENAPNGSEAPSNNDPRSLVSRISAEEGINPDLALRVARQESGFKQNVTSHAGAHGIMQLMPGTAKELGVDPNVPEQNVRGGVRYLKQMLEKYGGDEKLALAAYNAGPGRVDRYLAGKATLPAETQNYVASITGQTIDGRPHITVRKNWDEGVSDRSQNLVSNAGDPSVNMDLTALYGTSPEAMKRSEEFKTALAQTWPAQAVQEFYQASTLPGRVASGETTIDQAIEEAGLFASTFTGSGLATAQLRENALGIFGGRLRSHADNIALNKANELEIKGADPEKIWAETGWFKGSDGKWRNEISDDKAKINPDLNNVPYRKLEGYSARLEDLLKHEDLYKVYPELKNVKVSFRHLDGAAARFYPTTGNISVDPRYIRSDEDLLKSILHELQHSIQKKEGFSQGTNSEYRLHQLYTLLSEMIRMNPDKGDVIEKALVKTLDEIGGDTSLANALYMRAPGEIEARMVEERLKMTPAQRDYYSPMADKKTMSEENLDYREVSFPSERK